MARLSELPLEWAAAARPLPGEERSGDAWLVAPFPGGALLAVLDGVGHGEEAARAATTAREILAGSPAEPLPALVRRCHDGLRDTRGVVMSLAALDDAGEMRWLGVGNVAGALLRARGSAAEELLLRGGVVGAQLPPLQTAAVALGAGDRLVLATDGIAAAFPRDLARGGTVRAAAERILRRHARAQDDALALVASWGGGGR